MASEESLSIKHLISSTTAADKILFAVLMLLSLSGMIFMHEPLSRNATVEIEVNGKPGYLLPFEKNTLVSVHGPEGITVVQIKDGRVRFTESPCRNKLCVRQSWFSSGSVVCLPNKVVVTVERHEKRPTQVDAITG